MWQKGAFDGLAVAYGALALVALVSCCRCQHGECEQHACTVASPAMPALLPAGRWLHASQHHLQALRRRQQEWQWSGSHVSKALSLPSVAGRSRPCPSPRSARASLPQIQIVRIQLRVPEYGWTTQKVFHLLNFLVCGLRSGVFAARVAVQDLPYPLMQAVLLDLPGAQGGGGGG